MLRVDSGGDGFHGSWAHICDTCQAAASTVFCQTDSAYLCSVCDGCVHASNSLAFPHDRVWICTACGHAPAAVNCKADAASLCVNCDIEIHSANPLAARHVRVPVAFISSAEYPTSTAYPDELREPMLDTGNQIVRHENNEEIDEGEADSWLLLDPDENDNQPNSGFILGDKAADDKYLGNMEYNSSCTKYHHQQRDGEYNQQQAYSVYEGDNAGDSIVPAQSLEEQSQVLQQNIHFNGEYDASKAAFGSTSSSSQCVSF